MKLQVRTFALATRFLIFTLSMMFASACVIPSATAPKAAPTSSNTAATGAGDIVIYTSRAEALFKPVVAEFNKQHPNIKVTLLTGKGGELSAKLLEEAGNPKADIFINTDLMAMQDLAQKGVFQPNASASVQAVPEKYRASDGNWVGLTLRLRVIMYNTNLVKPEALPKSVLELTDPKWKGQVGATNSTSDAMIANIAALRQKLGDEKTATFIKGLADNETKFFGGHTDVRKAVAAGELKLGFVNHYYYHLARAEGGPVGVVYPDQDNDNLGLMFNATAVGIVKGAKNATAAQTFIDFMLSPTGQKVFAEKNYEYPITPGVALAAGVDPLDKLKLADLDLKTLYTALAETKALAQKAGLP